MSGYILCQVKRARLPYYIENISTNIYSIEELCFYLYHNIYLLDSTILNEELCFWIRDELGLNTENSPGTGSASPEIKRRLSDGAWKICKCHQGIPKGAV